MADCEVSDDVKTEKSSASSGFEDPLGVCKNEEESADEYDFDYYLSQISPSSTRTNTEVDISSLQHQPGQQILVPKRALSNDESTYLSLLREGVGEPTDDHSDGEQQDISIIIDNPEKHTTTMESFITFRITTKTTRSEFETSEFQVRRRYNDFIWLRVRLEEEHPTYFVPPLPEKHSLRRLDRFNQDFVSARMHALNTFLQRVCCHPILSFSLSLHTFLTAKQWEFQSAKSKEQSGLITRLAGSFQNLSVTFTVKNRPQDFTETLEYLSRLAEKLHSVEKVANRILKEQNDLLSDLNEWGPVFTLWSNSEDKLSPALVAMAKSIEKYYLALHEMVDSTEVHFLNPIKEYILYIDAVKVVLRRRDILQSQYESLLDEVTRKKEDKDHMTEEVIKLNKQLESLNDRLSCSNADLRADLDRWHRSKRKDFRKIFSNMAERQIRCYQLSLAAWEDAIPKIKKVVRGSEETKSKDGKTS